MAKFSLVMFCLLGSGCSSYQVKSCNKDHAQYLTFEDCDKNPYNEQDAELIHKCTAPDGCNQVLVTFPF